MGTQSNQVATESQIQSAFVEWCRRSEKKYPALKLAFSVPNGAWTKNYAMAAKLKREGMRPGVPDWMMPHSSKISIDERNLAVKFKHGLAIEFKRPGGKCTTIQLAYHKLLMQGGWQVEVCSDWQVARQIVEEYLG